MATLNAGTGDGVCYSYNGYGQLVTVKPAKYLSDTTYTETENAEEVEYLYNADNLLSYIYTEPTGRAPSFEFLNGGAFFMCGMAEMKNYVRYFVLDKQL